MKIKVFTAPTMAEAFDLVRAELGEDALIMGTEHNPSGLARVTAALEDAAGDEDVEEFLFPHESPLTAVLEEAFSYHGVPPLLKERLIQTAILEGKKDDPIMSCAAALDSLFRFHPLPAKTDTTAFMLVGPPGTGKTTIAAKLATRAKMKKSRPALVTVDTFKPGAETQLSAFAKILEAPLRKAKTPGALKETLLALKKSSDLVYIDTVGYNPFLPEDMAALGAFLNVGGIEPILVMPAGGDPVEAQEIAEAFIGIGVSRLIATRLDMSRRLGAILATAHNFRLTFCEVSISPTVSGGFSTINPVSLARLLLPSQNSNSSSHNSTRKS